MNDMAASADAPAAPASALWLPGTALNCYEGNAGLRSWLMTPGLLTQRIRDAAGAGFGMQVLGEFAVGTEHVREIRMSRGSDLWLFAQTRVPAATLAAQPWLARIGATPLGEALAARSGVTRSEFAYSRLYQDAPVVRRALEVAGLAPQPLWVRRSVFGVEGSPFELFEVFLPDIGTPEP